MSNHLVTPLQMCENFSQPEAPPLSHSHTVETPDHRSGVNLSGDADQAWDYGTLQSKIILPLLLLIKQLPAIGVALNESCKFMEYGRSQVGAAEESAQDILTEISSTLQDKVGPLPPKRHQARKYKAIALKYSNVLQRMEIQGAFANVTIDTRTIMQTFATLTTLLQEAEIYELPSVSSEKGVDFIAPSPKAAPMAPRWMIPGALVKYIGSDNVSCAARILAVHTDDSEGVTYCTISINGLERQTTGDRLRPSDSSAATTAEPSSEPPSAPPVRPRGLLTGGTRLLELPPVLTLHGE